MPWKLWPDQENTQRQRKSIVELHESRIFNEGIRRGGGALDWEGKIRWAVKGCEWETDAGKGATNVIIVARKEEKGRLLYRSSFRKA